MREEVQKPSDKIKEIPHKKITTRSAFSSSQINKVDSF